MNENRRPAVFIDRDGTINEEMGYINHLSRFILLDGVCEALRLLNKKNYLAIVVTNQSGVARGYFSIELFHRITEYMNGLLKKGDAYLDATLFCPHHPDAVIPAYKMQCDCRKPKTGLLREALARFDIDMDRSYVIGDRCIDMEFASGCGLPGIMVETGYGLGELEYVLPKSRYKPAMVARDLKAAVEWILSRQ